MLVSVIMPTYNCGKFILQSLDSVIAQTVTDWEVQIVDDCSTDNTAEVLKPYLKSIPISTTMFFRRMGDQRLPGQESHEAGDWQVYRISG